MTANTYAVDFILILSVDAWNKRIMEWWQYTDRPKTDRVTEAEDYKDAAPTAQTQLSIKDSGPEELKEAIKEYIKPPEPVNLNPPSMDIAWIEICPVCEEVLKLYYTKDINTGEKIYRCKNCFTELTKSNVGWVEKYPKTGKGQHKFPTEGL